MGKYLSGVGAIGTTMAFMVALAVLVRELVERRSQQARLVLCWNEDTGVDMGDSGNLLVLIEEQGRGIRDMDRAMRDLDHQLRGSAASSSSSCRESVPAREERLPLAGTT